jgi:autotransporter translocation and assembly factor TamB
VDLALVESFTPSLSAAHGRLNANLSLTGRPKSRAYEGFLRVDSAGAFVADLGIRVRNVFADIVAQGDTIDIRRISMVSGEESRDSLWIRGAVSLADVEDPAFDVTLGARDFHVIDLRRVGDLNISAALRFQGRQSASALSGNVVVNRGYVVIPPLTSKDVISLDDPDLYSVVDTSLAANRSLLPKAPPAIVRGMTVPTVQISMGSDVRLRSEEANIKLGGSVNVIVGRAPGGAPQLALEGALTTERGTFLMRFGDGFLSRLFTIEGGQVRFLGDADFNPDLDIRAIYTVRIASSRFATRSDVRIRARLLGTLVQPRIVLESADNLRMADSDLISYLITGRPSAEIGGLDYAGDFLLSSVSSNISARFSGRFFDYLQLQTASGGLGVGSTTAAPGAFSSLLQGAQLGVGKQLNDRTFVNLTAGLCQLGNQLGFVQTQSTTTLADAFGVSVEYAISRNLGVSLSREPPQQAAYTCVPTLIGFTATQPQWSLDFFRVWRW